MKLSKRLAKIAGMVSAEYDHIWDCCCDHGLLGAALLSRQRAGTVHFVDIVPELINEVEAKLKRFYPTASWQTHCLDVAALPLSQYPGKQLVIIAGVGGDLTMEFISALVSANPNAELEFLLCPVYHQYALRQRLIELDFGLIDEVLVEDNQRFYEILHVSINRARHAKVSPVGDKLWQGDGDRAKRYLNKTLAHYQRIEKGGNEDVRAIISSYLAVTL